MGIFSRKPKAARREEEKTLVNYQKPKPTLLRIFTSASYLLSVVFLILVEIGNINNDVVIRDTYFLNINLADIIPESVPEAPLINSIARTIGLHDFYQVGLWNYCEGYDDVGVTYCSHPEALYWFNPVQIILDELLAGATIALPTELTHYLHIVKVASHWMFACFMVGICATFLCIFLAPMGFSKQPRWQHKRKRIFLRQLPITIITFIAALFTTVATVIATAMFYIFKNVFGSAAEFNIEAKVGTPMMAFMWIAVGFNLIGFFMQIGTCCGVCCCTGRRKALVKEQRQSYGGDTMAETKTTDVSNSKKRFGFGRG